MRWWRALTLLAALGCGETQKVTQGGEGGELAQAGAADAGAGGVAMHRPLPCGDGSFVLPEKICVPRRDVCDGKADCDNAADEANCPGFLCFDGALLLPRVKKCDGVANCADSSDESECTVP